MSNQLSLFEQPIACGIFKGVSWQSMISVQNVRSIQLEKLWKQGVEISNDLNIQKFNIAEVLYVKYKTTVHEFLNRSLTNKERLAYYNSKATYNNNYKVKP